MKFNTLPILLATTFLSTNAVAQTVPEINADYLNSLTDDNVTWEVSKVGEENTVEIDGKYYKFTYNNTGNYAETSTRINNTLATSNVTDVLFRSISSTSSGGAIYNYNKYNSAVNINADFIDNHANSVEDFSGGGAINNYCGEIGDIVGNFISNYAKEGGAIYNSNNPRIASEGIINNIAGIFIDNHASERGGAIFNYDGYGMFGYVGINNIVGDFIGNSSGISGGAIFTSGPDIKQIIGNFISNHTNEEGGAILNASYIENISGNFIGNYAKINSDTSLAYGGAIYTYARMSFLSNQNTNFFDGNYTSDKRGKIYNAIYVYSTSATMTFDTSGGGAWVINDNVENGNYNFIGDDTLDAELGTTTQYINMNNAIVNAGEVSIENTTLRFGNYQHEDTIAKNWDGKGKFIASLNSDGTENLDADSVTSLTLNNAVFDIANGYLETIKLKKFTSTENTSNFVHLDVDVENMKSDVINVKGDVDGVTKLIIHATSDKDIRNQGQILFAESFGDTKGNENSFEVARVYKSPYLYDVVYEGVENTTTTTESKDNKWSLEMNGDDNPNKEQAPVDPNPDVPTPDTPNTPTQPFGPIQVAPEVIGFEALTNVALAQTNGMVYNIMRKVGINHLYCPGCGFYDYNWDGKPLHNVWVDTTYNGLTIEAPVEIEAKVWGIEAGSDLQHDLNNKLGIFVSYRQGNYEMDGKGEKYYSTIGSEIDIDSYLAGLYYRYDNNNWYAFATVYGGMQNAEIKTDDGISADTDGIEFGGSIEGGYNYALTRTLSVTPSLGVFYSQISYDDATDNVGKTVEYNDLKQVELEAGAKFAYTQYTDNGFYSLYVKPSVVQTLVDGDEIDVTELGKVDTIDDKTLGRIEIGGNYGFNDNWSAYGWANYTFGSDYEATSLGAGLNYAW